MRRRWDIFCRVIDNFGDIGICWRLAKQLTREFHQEVRLRVDDLFTFHQLVPEVNPEIQNQIVQGIGICRWLEPLQDIQSANVVIEAFGCDLPDDYLIAMLRMKPLPVWINLEYLSAEPWVADYHRLPSPHPRFPLVKTFFFPGFVKGTGGLLRESDLTASQSSFDKDSKEFFLQRNGLLERQPGCVWVSLFCYDSAPVETLIQVLSESPRPVVLIVPHGKISARISAILASAASPTPNLIIQYQLTVQIIPFLEQSDYDQLLWSCDINFVRGEDSFVRAQWAVKPFIWNIYPQQENTHWKKLDAFLDLYTAQMPEPMAAAVRVLWHGWNGREELNAAAWMNFLVFQQSLLQHNKNWVNRLLEQGDLASNLVQFVENRL